MAVEGNLALDIKIWIGLGTLNVTMTGDGIVFTNLFSADKKFVSVCTSKCLVGMTLLCQPQLEAMADSLLRW
jgi:hypothetical protein